MQQPPRRGSLLASIGRAGLILTGAGGLFAAFASLVSGDGIGAGVCLVASAIAFAALALGRP